MKNWPVILLVLLLILMIINTAAHLANRNRLASYRDTVDGISDNQSETEALLGPLQSRMNNLESKYDALESRTENLNSMMDEIVSKYNALMDSRVADDSDMQTKPDESPGLD